MQILHHLGGLRLFAKGGQQGGNRHAIARGFRRHGRRVQHNLTRGAVDIGGGLHRDQAELALHAGKLPLNQQHGPQHSTVRQQPRRFIIAKEVTIERGIGGVCGHGPSLSGRDRAQAQDRTGLHRGGNGALIFFADTDRAGHKGRVRWRKRRLIQAHIVFEARSGMATR